jgi:uncharacterized protein (TIGR03382 family)
MYGFARSDDGARVWAGSDVVGLYRSDDRGETFAPVPGGVSRVNCLAARGDELWACGNDFVDGFALGVSRDGGATFEAKLRYRDIVGVPECAPEAPVSVVCGPRFPALQAMFGGGAPDGGVGDGGASGDLGPATDSGPARDLGAPGGGTASGCCSVAAGARTRAGYGGAGSLGVAVAAFVAVLRRRRARPAQNPR